MVLAAAWYLSGTPAGFRTRAVTDPGLDAALASVHFIDVGQGAASLVACGGEFALIDTGTDASKEELVSYVRTAGAQRLELVVLTHLHDDHTGGFSEILRAFDIGTVLLPDTDLPEEMPDDGAQTVLEELAASGVPTQEAVAEMSFELGGGHVTVLTTGVGGGDVNDACVIVRFDGGGLSCLFGADAQEAELNALIDSRADVEADVYAVAHHGSGSGAIPELFRKIGAQYAVVSCGRDNLFGHPHEDTVRCLEQAGAQVLRTDQSGSIAVYADQEGLIQAVTQRGSSA